MKYASSFASKEMRKEALNKGTSFIVAPHNKQFDKKAIIATENNHKKVIEDIESIL